MLGKHVNVSVKNKKFMHKVLCVILAIVLIGLMVPNGLAAQLNAYAGNETETPTADTPAVNEEQLDTPAEEVTTPEAEPINYNDPTDIHFIVNVTFPAGVYLDDTNGAGTASLPTHWSVTEKSDVQITKITRDYTIPAGDPVPLKGDIVDELNIYRSPNGTSKDLIKCPEGCALEDFIITGDPTGSTLGSKVVSGISSFTPIINTSIVVNPGTEGGTPTNPQLLYLAQGGSYGPYEGWPDSPSVLHLQLGSTWKTDNKVLSVTGSSLFGDHKIYEFVGKLECDNLDFNGFVGPDGATSGKVAYGTVFNGTWTDLTTTVKFQSNPEDIKTAGSGFYVSSDGGNTFTPTTWNDLTGILTNNTKYNIVENIAEGYSGGLRIGDKIYAFNFGTPTIGINKYEFAKWEVSTTGAAASYIEVSSTETEIPAHLVYFRATFIENYKFTPSTDLTPTDLKIYTSKAVDQPTWTEIPAAIYYDNTYAYKISDNGYLTVGHYENGLFVADDYFDASGATGYRTGKWTVNGSDVGETETHITSNVDILAVMQVMLTFGINPSTPTAGGHVEDGSKATVTGVYAYPGKALTLGTGSDANKITIDADTYTAVPTEDYEFIKWTLPEGVTNTVPSAPKTITVQFALTPVVRLDLDDEDYDDYLEAPLTSFDWGDAVQGLKVGSTIKRDASDKTKLVFGNTTSADITFSAALTALGTHYLAFGNSVWYIKDSSQAEPSYTEITTEGITLEDGDSYSIVIIPDVLDLLELSGTFKTLLGNVFSGAKVTADVTIEGNVVTQYTTTDENGDYSFTDLPVNVKVDVYAFAPGYNPGELTISSLTQDKDDADITIFEDRAFAFTYGSGVSGKDWTDTTGVKTISSSANITPLTGVETYNFADQTTLTITVCQNDSITLGNFTGDIHTNKVSFNGGSDVTWTRSHSYTISTEGQSTLTITFKGENHVDFIAIDAADRTVTFEVTKADGSSATGSFLKNGETAVTTLDVPGIGATYKLNSDKTIVTFTDGETTTNIQAKASQDTGTESIFREWVDVSTTAVPIVDNITIKARFVQENVVLKFDKGSSEVAAEGTADTTIKMDSVFSQVRTDSSHANAIFTLGSTPDTKTINIKDTDKVKYKFAETVFSGVAQGKEKIDEKNYTTIEADGLTLTYSIIKKTPIDVTIDLRDGHLVGDYKFKDVPTTDGGIGAWTHDPSTDEYKNSFYEEYPIATIVSTYLIAKEANITKDSGFFNETWEGPTTGQLSTATTWTANYDDAAHVTVNVKESKPDSPAALANMTVVLESQDTDIAPGTKTVTGVATATTGAYDLKVYGYSKYQKYITGDLTAGGKEYIEKSDELVESDWNGSSATKDFALDKGYSFFASDLGTYWYAKYYVKDYSVSPYIYANKVSTEGGQAALKDDAFLEFASGNNIIQDSGNEIIIWTSTTSGHFNAEIPDLLTEDAAITSNKFLYTVWSESKIFLRNSNGEEAKKFSRVDYRIPWEDYISVSGPVTDKETGNPLSGIKVSYSATNSNEPVEEKYTNDKGYYYIVIKTLKGDEKGTVLFEDVDGNEDDHLDERVRLSSKDTSDIRPTSPADSGDWSKPAMIPAIHVTGMITQPKPGAEETEAIPVENAAISFQQDSSDPYTWNNDIHSPAYTGTDGTYTLKLRKDANTSGGTVWFSKEGYTLDGHLLALPNPSDPQNPTPLPHGPNDIDNISGMLTLEGASVTIEGGSGHKLFEVKYYNAGRCYMTKEMESVDELNFAQNGVFQSVYGESGSLLRYEFKAAGIDDFAITLRPVAGDGYTYWAWRCFDKTDNKKWTLKDQEKIGDDGKLATHQYKFTVDYAEGTEVTVGGNASVGHAGWYFDLTVESGGVAGEAIHDVIGSDDYSFMIPITQNQEPEYANETTEEINVGYSFKDGTFNLELNTEFQPDTGDPVPYTERRAFTPIPAEGYMFTGIAVNGQDLVPGAQETIDLTTGNLNVVAKYAEIPNPASTGDSTPNMMWLVGLAILAMLGIAFGASRKQKGIRC